VVDYLYFSGRVDATATACAIQELPERVKFDATHLSTYQIEGKLNYSACP
jgi:hypothetical protein